MNLTSLDLAQTYDTSNLETNPVQDFLEPCLKLSVSYDRLSGYFSSRVFALAAVGLSDFLAGNGVMRLVMSSQLTNDDFQFLVNAERNGTRYDHLFGEVTPGTDAMASLLERKHHEAMCWLLAQGRLEIRIAVYKGDTSNQSAPIYHPKIGIFTDADGNRISFSGSVNETAAGWSANLEEFKVFKSWDPSTSIFVDQDLRTFERHWNLDAGNEFRVISLPEAIKQKLISLAPDEVPQIKSKSFATSIGLQKPILRDYQKNAVEAWLGAGKVGILEMATGTGKTKTARSCIEKVLATDNALILVTAPYEHIARQWMKELESFNPTLASGNTDWRGDIQTARSNKLLRRTKNLLIVAVQNTASSSDFQELINECAIQFNESLFVGDEVHGLGATSFQRALNPLFKYRLGLSATPERYFDELGTQALVDYFGETVFSFPTSEAMRWNDPETGKRALCDYKYFPHFVALSGDELNEIEGLSEKILKLSGSDLDRDSQIRLELLLFKRAAVIKKAESKIPALYELLKSRIHELHHALIYSHDMEQLSEVAQLLLQFGVSYQKITGDESTAESNQYGGISERDWILNNFGNGTTKVLLAIKCLDEGVDIPEARVAYILASSGNPREFIQRRGRLLRPSNGKEFAEIHDFVVTPNLEKEEKASTTELSTLKKELKRLEELSTDAINTDEVRSAVAKVILKIGEQWTAL